MKKLFLRPSILLFLITVLVYCANARTIGAGDTLPARYLPFSLLLERNFNLDEFPFLYDEWARQVYPIIDGVPYFLRYRNGHYVSAYSPGAALLALPVYLAPVLAGLPPTSPWVPHLEKLAAALITALSVVFLFWALRALVAEQWAVGIAIVYAFGTSSLSISSQALWQHGPSQFFMALSLYLLVRGAKEERWLPYAGFSLASAVLMRATNAFIALPLGLFVLFRASKRVGWGFLLYAMPPALFLLAYNLLHFGSIVGADYGHIHMGLGALFSQIPIVEGVSGLLFSPARGLFVYSPVLLFSLAGMVKVWRAGPPMLKPLVLGVLGVLLFSGKWFMWWGGHTYGPRLLADIAPILCFFLYPLCDEMRRRPFLKRTLLLLAGLSISAHALGAFFYDGRWDGMANIDQNYSRLWSWKRGPLVEYGREAAFRARQLVSPMVRGALRLPTSADSPLLLAASYAMEPIPSPVFAGEPVSISFRAINAGRAVWLASSDGDRGTVRLGWRWYRENREIAAGREPLLSDVFPGESVRFSARSTAPVEPGTYTLAFELVSEQVSWFSDRGVEPVRAAVRVLSPDFDRLAAEAPEPATASPSLAIVTDRPRYRHGETLHLQVELATPHRPRSIDAYLALRRPDGRVLFYDGHALFPPQGMRWAAWVKGIPLPAQAIGRFTLPLSGFPAGPYAWYALVTDAGTFRVRAKAIATFTLES